MCGSILRSDRSAMWRWHARTHAACVGHSGKRAPHIGCSHMTTQSDRCPPSRHRICSGRKCVHPGRSRWHFSTIRQTSWGHDLLRSLCNCTAQDIFRSDRSVDLLQTSLVEALASLVLIHWRAYILLFGYFSWSMKRRNSYHSLQISLLAFISVAVHRYNFLSAFKLNPSRRHSL